MGKVSNIELTLNHNDQNDDGHLVLEQVKPKLKKPSMYQVIMYNDDFTPMEFVVEVLEMFFNLHRERPPRSC